MRGSGRIDVERDGLLSKKLVDLVMINTRTGGCDEKLDYQYAAATSWLVKRRFRAINTFSIMIPGLDWWAAGRSV